MKHVKKIALVGNPNCGKTTLLNLLTGLNQKVGNFPGVTVNKKSGEFKLSNNKKIELIDLPGTYSLSSKSEDEKIVQDVLLNQKNANYPDLILLVIDATNLKRNLFLTTQIIDLGIPCLVALNMTDELESKGIVIDIEKLSKALDSKIYPISSKLNIGIDALISEIEKESFQVAKPFIKIPEKSNPIIHKAFETATFKNQYTAFKIINNTDNYNWINKSVKNLIKELNYNPHEAELFEINDRYTKINKVIAFSTQYRTASNKSKIDEIVAHPLWGGLIFFSVFFILFQTVFTLAGYPMELIDSGMEWFSNLVATMLPKGLFNSFIVDGLLAGIGGIIIFLPQIMLLFGMITLLEDSGYLSRISFVSDKLLSYFGMNGKSIIPLVGGFACAIPAIMAARNIESKKERFITIFITPLMSCSARLPVYVFLVSYIVPNEFVWGIINLQGLFMMGLYLIGIIFSLIIAVIINTFQDKKIESSFLLELPDFKTPNFKNILFSMLNKGKIFLKEAGKIIIIVSIILWFLSSFGPTDERQRIEAKYSNELYISKHKKTTLEANKRAELLEHSYIGHIGKVIEPAIEPLGFDWKIGIALITSFAAREVFVGTMETIYSIEGGLSNGAIDFSLATAFSLLIFYVFALQCMSTLAIVKQETGSWKIASIQFFVFTGLAYIGSFITYQLLS